MNEIYGLRNKFFRRRISCYEPWGNLIMKISVLVLCFLSMTCVANQLDVAAADRVANIFAPSEFELEGIRKSVVAYQIQRSPEMAEHQDFILSLYEKYFTRKELLVGFAALYEKHFSVDELESIADFYSTSAGKKLLAKKTIFDQERDGVFAERFEAMAPKIKKEISDYFKRKSKKAHNQSSNTDGLDAAGS